MRADKFLTVMAVAVAVATAAATFATVPSADAQTPTHVRHHTPVRVTVYKRSYLHPGTETKTHAEHYADYYHSPSWGYDSFRNSTLFQSGPALPFHHDRMPFPTCFELSGFCR
jgi:hypothetical protein